MIPVAIENPIYVGRVAELGDNYTVVFETSNHSRRYRHGSDLQGTAGRPLSLPALGVVVKGRWTARYGDHEETFEAGDVFYSPPGHLPLAAPGTELITISPTAELAKVNAVIAKNQAELAASRL